MTASPGFIIDLHSTLVRKDELQNALVEELKTAPISKNTKEISQWILQHQPDHKTDDLLISKFTVQIASENLAMAHKGWNPLC
eukprot:15335694-Ditylum_brightwellii.AAC.1